MQRILVATDGKPPPTALHLASTLASREEAALDVLTVLPPLPNLDALRTLFGADRATECNGHRP